MLFKYVFDIFVLYIDTCAKAFQFTAYWFEYGYISDAYTIFAGYHLFFDGHFGVFPKSRNRYDHFPFFLTYSVVFEWIFMATIKHQCFLENL